MSGMHVHQHQPLGVFRKDVDAFELRQRIAQRRNVILTGWQRDRVGLGQRREELAIGGLRFCHRNR
ncbi:hypothetical protein D3C76_1440700 [compost metagenome]